MEKVEQSPATNHTEMRSVRVSIDSFKSKLRKILNKVVEQNEDKLTPEIKIELKNQQQASLSKDLDQAQHGDKRKEAPNKKGSARSLMQDAVNFS